MDQRRFFSFLLLSIGIWMLINILFNAIAPPPQQPKRPAPVAGADAPAEKPADNNAAEHAESVPAKDEPANAQPGVLPEIGAANISTQYLTLGSLDPADGYRMLVTVTNRGAAVVRAEMSSSRFRDQHDRAGYLGELELTSTGTGAKVEVVGAGTPAAAAGIEVGDVIVGVGDLQKTAINKADDLRAALARTRPGEQVTLQVKRGDGAAQPKAVKLGWRPFAVVRPEIDNYRMRDVKPPADFVDRPSFLMSLAMLDLAADALPAEQLAPTMKFSLRIAEMLETGNWEVADHSPTSVTFKRPLPEIGFELIKRYSIAAVPEEKRGDPNYPGYHVQLDVELKNTSDKVQTISYRLDGPTGMPLEGWWWAHKISQRWFRAAGLRDVVVRFFGSPELQVDCPQIAEDDVEPMGQGQALAYAGVDGQYFAAVMLPKKKLEENWFDSTEAIVVGAKPDPRTLQTFTNVTCRLTRQPLQLEPGASRTDGFQIFIGPKRPALLAQYQAGGDPNYSLKDIIYYGLALFGAVARLMLVVLHFFYGIVGNYGIAIIMLTIVVRGAMFPISYKQTKNMARIQELKPEMDRISEKYKNDMQKKSQAIQELYRKHQINPLGGCLPVFLQMPIFIGLYRALMIDVELRQSPLFGHGIRWCSNLAAPDMFLDWSPVMPSFITNGVGLFGLGPYLNVLPLITVALFLVTQKMAMPAPTNEQAVLQQKMMKYMTMFMGLLFYKVASGLCLYFIASSLWGIAERKLLPKTQPVTATADGGTGLSAPSDSGKRPGGGSNGSPRSKKSKNAKRKK